MLYRYRDHIRTLAHERRISSRVFVIKKKKSNQWMNEWISPSGPSTCRHRAEDNGVCVRTCSCSVRSAWCSVDSKQICLETQLWCQYVEFSAQQMHVDGEQRWVWWMDVRVKGRVRRTVTVTGNHTFRHWAEDKSLQVICMVCAHWV